jgi:hypothetical protein
VSLRAHRAERQLRLPAARRRTHQQTDEGEDDGAKEWISSKEAAALIGRDKSVALELGRAGTLETRQPGGYARAPMEFKRSSVIAYLDKRKHADMLDEPKATKSTPKKTAPPSNDKPQAIAPRERSLGAKQSKAVAAPSGGLVDDVRALLRNVDRGWMTADAMLGHLRGLVD